MNEPEIERFLELILQHTEKLVLFASQRCQDPEDVVQDAMLQLFREPKLPAQPLPWQYRVYRKYRSARSRIPQSF